MIEIKCFEQPINYTPACEVSVKAQAALFEERLSEPVLSLYWDNNAIVAFDGNESVGVISWKYSEWMRTVNVHMTWVDKRHRRRGIYKMLWEALVREATKLKAA